MQYDAVRHTYRIRLYPNLHSESATKRLKRYAEVVTVSAWSAVAEEQPLIYDSVNRLTRHLTEIRNRAVAREYPLATFLEDLFDLDTTMLSQELARAAGEREIDYLAAHLHYLRRHAFPHDTVDWTAYQRAAEQRRQMMQGQRSTSSFSLRAMRTPSPFLTTWEVIGPSNVINPNGQFQGVEAVSGRVNGVAYDPRDPGGVPVAGGAISEGTYYIATAGGGIWRSTKGGAEWQPLSNGSEWVYQQTSCVAIAYTLQRKRIIYAGTGDFYGLRRYGSGVLISEDDGLTWSKTGANEFGNRVIASILVDPDDPSIITVATGTGMATTNPNDPANPQGFIWRTTDGGKNWSRVVDTRQPSDILPRSAWASIQCGPPDGAGTRYYYAVGINGPGEVWRSSNRGATWMRLSPQFKLAQQTALALAPSASDPKSFYLLSGTERKLWKCTVDFDTATNRDIEYWNNVDLTTFPSVLKDPVHGQDGDNWSQSAYDIHLTCSKNTGRDVLFVGLITLARLDFNQTPARWEDIGRTFEAKAPTHNDQHSMVIHPTNPNEALIGNDGGVYRVTWGASGIRFESLNQSLKVAQIYQVATHPANSSILLVGAQDIASPFVVTDLANWKSTGSGDGGFSAIDPVNAGVQLGTAAFDYSNAKNRFLVFYKTKDFWLTSLPPEYIPVNQDNIAFLPPLVRDPTHVPIYKPDVVYMASNYLYRWSGGQWSGPLGGARGGRLSRLGYIQCLAVAERDSKRIYVGSVDGELWMMTEYGGVVKWERINGAGPMAGSITTISVHPSNPDDILVGIGGSGVSHLWHCSDTTPPVGTARVWTPISHEGALSPGGVPIGLPDIHLNAIARHPDDPTDTLYAATDGGVFVTTDGGDNWTPADVPFGMPAVEVYDLKSVPGTGHLYAGTFGRGVWRIKIAEPMLIAHFVSSTNSVRGGRTISASVTLSRPAPKGGLTIYLAASDPAVVSVPSMVSVLEGQTSASVSIGTNPVRQSKAYSISALANGSRHDITLTVNP
jgi:photosystem II stability/assembly factor-like uncharacterized protein